MAEDTVSVSPPYSTYRQFTNLLNGLGETQVPSRIDRSLFGNMSGGTAYSLLSTLKFLKLTDNEGVPQPLLRELVEAGEDERKPLIKGMLEEAYSGLINGPINLAEASGGQFDEALREQYSIKGSTVDKVAAFFLAAADEAGIALSPHLKKRKPSTPSPSRRRAARKPQNGGTPAPPPPPQLTRQKSLSHMLTDMLNVSDMSEEEMGAVWILLRYQKRKEAEEATAKE